MRLIVALSFFISLCQPVAAQEAIPVNPDVKIGRLENGLTYYIRTNAKPKDRVELRLVVKTGSIHEDSLQLGLAHFSEHMAFNGTASFKENELVSFLQSAGVEFGADLNAYTSFNETVYILPLPKTSLELIEKGMNVLYEWAGKISFDSTEIDKERGIVIEEWRLGKGAEDRVFNKQIGVWLQGSRYAERLPIGKKEILESFKYEEIRRFYKDWYRADLMAVVVVGDIEPKWAEETIRKTFSRLPKPATPITLPEYDIPVHNETRVTVESDPELTFTSASLNIKHPRRPVKNTADYRESFKRSLFNQLLRARLDERGQEAKPPFLFAYSGYYGSFSPKKDFFELQAVTPDTSLLYGFRELMREAERVRRFGFLESELIRAKASVLRGYEKAYSERNSTESEQLTYELVNHFLEGEIIPGIAYELEFAKKTLPGITLAEISALASELMTKENRVIVASAPQRDGLTIPTREQLLGVLADVETEPLEPWKDAALPTSLLSEIPAGGALLKKKEFPKTGVVEWTFKNGVRVVAKPTTFKTDEIRMSAFSPGGVSIASDGNAYSAGLASGIVRNSGAGAFSSTDLQKFLAGKVVSAGPNIGSYSEGFSGSASPKDLETLFELVYLYATSPRNSDADYENLVNYYREFLRGFDRNPEQKYYQATSEVLYGKGSRALGISRPEDMDKVSKDSALAFYRNRFADFSDFTFFFTGSFTNEQLLPLAQKYLGSLPSLKRKESFVDRNDGYRITKIDTAFYFGTEPKSMVRMIWSGPMTFNTQNRYDMRAMQEVLDIVLINEIREKMSGVYGISGYGTVSKIPRNEYNFEISFPCAPENVEPITKRVREIVAGFAAKGPSAEDLAKVKETRLQQTKVALETNDFWLRNLEDAYKLGLNQNDILDWKKRLDKLSPAAIQKMAQSVFNPAVEKRFVLQPASK